MHMLNHNLARDVCAMHFGILFKIQEIKQVFVSLILKHWFAMFQNVRQCSKLD